MLSNLITGCRPGARRPPRRRGSDAPGALIRSPRRMEDLFSLGWCETKDPGWVHKVAEGACQGAVWPRRTLPRLRGQHQRRGRGRCEWKTRDLAHGTLIFAAVKTRPWAALQHGGNARDLPKPQRSQRGLKEPLAPLHTGQLAEEGPLAPECGRASGRRHGRVCSGAGRIRCREGGGTSTAYRRTGE